MKDVGSSVVVLVVYESETEVVNEDPVLRLTDCVDRVLAVEVPLVIG